MDSWALKSGLQACQQVPLSVEPYHWPLWSMYCFISIMNSFKWNMEVFYFFMTPENLILREKVHLGWQYHLNIQQHQIGKSQHYMTSQRSVVDTLLWKYHIECESGGSERGEPPIFTLQTAHCLRPCHSLQQLPSLLISAGIWTP